MTSRRMAIGVSVLLLGGIVTPVDPVDAARPAAVPAPRAAEELPDGWAVEHGVDGEVLVWNGSSIQMGGSRPEFRLAGTLLGYPRETDGGSLRLTLSAEQAAAVDARPQRLSVWSSGRRLDRPPHVSNRVGYDSVPEPTAVSDIDPSAVGPYATERLAYDLAPLDINEYPAPVEVVAEVTRPLNAPGDRPLVLILHGRHSTCFRGGPSGDSSGDWPCLDGWEPIPSHQGYRYMADVLASRGYVTVSIAANGINGQDYQSLDGGAAARSELIRHHLVLWAAWAAQGGDPWGGVMQGQVDMRNVVLVGHSRGGEGVNRAAVDTRPRAPYRIRGIVSIGPTAFGRQVTPDITSATILPACDGDVSDLQGQFYVDGSRDIARSSALRSAVLALGANHNFFNTEWTPGLAQAPSFDDWWNPFDPTCGDTGTERLTATEQQKVGLAYTMALVRLTVGRDPAMLRFLDGTKVTPRSIGDAHVSTSAVGGASRSLYRAEDPGTPVFSGGMSGLECPGYVTIEVRALMAACPDPYSAEIAPHWLTPYGMETKPAPAALELLWSTASAWAGISVGDPGTGVDLSLYDTVDVRVANDPQRAPARLAVRVRDAAGRATVLNADIAAVDGWPGTGNLDRIEARTLRARLASARGIDLRHVVAVDLVVGAPAGHVWVLDISAVRHRVTWPRDLDLPRFAVETLTSPEGAAGEVTSVDVRILVRGVVRAPVRLWVRTLRFRANGMLVDRHTIITVPTGATGAIATITLPHAGDDWYDPPYPSGMLDGGTIVISALENGLTSRYVGGVRLVEDDAPPVVTAEASEVTADEAGVLAWTLHLSAPTSGMGFIAVAGVPDGGATEMSSDDVEATWLESILRMYDWETPLPIDPPVPLSDVGRDRNGTGLRIMFWFEPGSTDAIVAVLTRTDATTEGDEVVALDVLTGELAPLPGPALRLVGIVPANST